MKYNDHLLMEEAYNKISETNLEEGIFDRIKGTASGIKKAFDISKDALSDNQHFIGKGGAWEDIKKGYKGGKSSTVVKSHIQKLYADIDDFIEDLKKVGNVTENSIANYDQASQFLKGIIKNLATTSGRGQVSVTGLKTALGKAGFLKKPARGQGGRFASENPEQKQETADVQI